MVPSTLRATTKPLRTLESYIPPPKILETLTYSESKFSCLVGNALMQALAVNSVIKSV